MEPKFSWLIKVQHEVVAGPEKNYWPSGCIYKLPATLINVKTEDYKPEIVSIGPYHYGEPNLKPMEEHKDRALLHFLRRSKGTIVECWDELEKVVDDLKLAYTMLDTHWRENTEDFLQLMIRDGCFLLELFWPTNPTFDDYDPNDHIFSKGGMAASITRDTLLLENQLPFQVLRRLFAVYEGYKDMGDKRIDDLIHKLVLDAYFENAETIHIVDAGRDVYQLLDLYLANVAFIVPGKPQVPPSLKWSEIFWSAREMHDAGMWIKRSKTRSLSDIRFHGGILELPAYKVDILTERVFSNLVAFERLQYGIGQGHVTSYIYFMATIIDNASDVSFLRSLGIIEFGMLDTTDEDIAKLFKMIVRDTSLDIDNELGVIYDGLSRYRNTSWNQWRGYINRTYFRNPWASISLIGSAVLFVLASAQTLYTIISYYK